MTESCSIISWHYIYQTSSLIIPTPTRSHCGAYSYLGMRSEWPHYCLVHLQTEISLKASWVQAFSFAKPCRPNKKERVTLQALCKEGFKEPSDIFYYRATRRAALFLNHWAPTGVNNNAATEHRITLIAVVGIKCWLVLEHQNVIYYTNVTIGSALFIREC